MEEVILKQFFEKFDNEFNKNLQREFMFYENRRIDYVIDTGTKMIGIEVKGSRADLDSVIGQLFTMKQIFSDLYLLAPLNLIKKIIKISSNTNFLNEIGLLTISRNNLIILKRPESKEYYFRYNHKQLKKYYVPKNQAIINENDIEIIAKFKDRIFTVIDLMHAFGLHRENAYRRIARLRKANVIEEVDPTINPKSYKIIKIIHEPQFIHSG